MSTVSSGQTKGVLLRASRLIRPDPGTAEWLGTAGVVGLLVLAWIRVTTPQLVQILQNGRPAFNSAVDSMPPAGRVLGDVTTAAFIGLALLLTAYGLRHRRPDRLWALVVVLAPLAAIHLAGLVNGQPPGPVSLALPIAVVAIWVLRPGAQALAAVGVLGAATAVVAMLLAVVRPDLGLLTGADAGNKGWAIGGLLAGPYPHSNVLGLILALSLPFGFGIRPTAARRVTLTLILVALLWTGSRTSQLAAIVVLLTWGLLRWRRTGGRADRSERSRRRHLSMLIGVPLVVALGLIILCPLLTTDPAGFTNRGRTWRALLSRWAERPLTGHGPEYFERQPDLAAALGGRYTHGHNVLVHLLTIGGLLTVVLFAVLLYQVWRRSMLLAGAGTPGPALFLVALLWVSWLEASHVSVTLAGYLTWLPLGLIARAELPRPVPEQATSSEDQDVP
ncbi:O-antigen ligase family protein [Micromonospora sp. NPDC023888]|uniref:O-antigen ligase family protein n=1 Tax=Micromonospora sp. NPDC023888 TaxID=3155607 RepID=UPI0033F4D60F